MLTIRLARRGAKKRPFYHIVVTDSRQARDGGAIKESIGYFNPLASQNENSFKIAVDRFNYWLSTGAKPSERVAKLIKLSKKVVSEVSVENRLSPSSDIR